MGIFYKFKENYEEFFEKISLIVISKLNRELKKNRISCQWFVVQEINTGHTLTRADKLPILRSTLSIPSLTRRGTLSIVILLKVFVSLKYVFDGFLKIY